MGMAAASEPDTVLLNYECHGRDCNELFPLSALTVVRAELDPTAREAA